MGNERKRELTEQEHKDCDTFKRTRNRCGMSQSEWAETIGISLGLVKSIENHSRRCSEKTKTLVADYLTGKDEDPDSPDTLSLEKHVLADIFLTHMTHIPRKDASVYAKYCAQQVLKILSSASSLKSAETQSCYFKFLVQTFSVIALTVPGIASDIKIGENVLEPASGLDTIFKKPQTKKYLAAGDIQISANGHISVQQSLDNM